MIAAALTAVTVALYIYGVQRYRERFPNRTFGALRIASFVTGSAVLGVALSAPFDALADRSFAWHMVQHLCVAFVAPPLLLLGAPLLLLVAATPREVARALTRFAESAPGRAIFAPITGWLAMVFVLWGTHFSPLYERALESPPLHVVEHALFFLSGMLFWGAVVQVGYAPRPVAFPARMLFLFLALPQGAFVAFALAASTHVLYRHYAAVLGAATALNDQRAGADVMWIAGGFLLFCAFMLEGAAWAVSERSAAVA